MKTLYAQLRDIITVKVYDKKIPYNNYEYVDKTIEKKKYDKWYHRLIFKKTIVKEHYQGYYEDYYKMGFNPLQKVYSADDLRKENLIVEDETRTVYIKPYIELGFRNKDSYHHYFENMQELDKFLQPILIKNRELTKIIS